MAFSTSSVDLTSALKLQEKKDHLADLRLRRVFGITLQRYNEILRSQNGCCKICKHPPVNVRLSVDHDHRFDRIKIVIMKLKNPKNDRNFSGFCLTSPNSIARMSHEGKTRKEVRKILKLYLRRKSLRGLLCISCNRGLQKFYDKPERFEAAAKYLREFEGKLSHENNTQSVTLDSAIGVPNPSEVIPRESQIVNGGDVQRQP